MLYSLERMTHYYKKYLFTAIKRDYTTVIFCALAQLCVWKSSLKPPGEANTDHRTIKTLKMSHPRHKTLIYKWFQLQKLVFWRSKISCWFTTPYCLPGNCCWWNTIHKVTTPPHKKHVVFFQILNMRDKMRKLRMGSCLANCLVTVTPIKRCKGIQMFYYLSGVRLDHFTEWLLICELYVVV